MLPSSKAPRLPSKKYQSRASLNITSVCSSPSSSSSHGSICQIHTGLQTLRLGSSFCTPSEVKQKGMIVNNNNTIDKAIALYNAVGDDIDELKKMLEESSYDSSEDDKFLESNDDEPENGKILLIKCPELGISERVFARQDENLSQILKRINCEYDKANIVVDDCTFNTDDISLDIIDDCSVIVLTPKLSKQEHSIRKLVFMLPDGSKKNLSLDSSLYFRDILQKLDIPHAKLLFDGEFINLDQKICENSDLDQEDQIDVVLS